MRAARSHGGWAWAGLGLAGSAAITLAGPGILHGQPVVWWFDPGVPAHTVVFYAGIVALCAAWLGLGRTIGCPGGASVRTLLLVGALWCVPVALAPGLFSRDMYSYLADGAILHLGLDPYHQAPAVLGQLHQTHVLAAVSPFWRHTTAPYGPAFIGLASLIFAAVGSNLVAGVLLLRLVELVGVALLAVFVPRLARLLGADPARATWLAVISPLVVLELVGAGHNDAVMAGLLVAGVTLALERRPLVGIALCALAATVKLPAAAGVLFITIAWARDEPQRAAQIVALSAIVAGAVVLAVSATTGLGLDWIAGSLSTPARVRLAITPSTALGYSIAAILHAFDVGVSSKGLEHAVATVGLALTAALGAALAYRVRRENLVFYLGLLLLASVIGGPAAWPWYAIWGLALVACCPEPQRRRWLPVVIVVTSFLIRADGQLVLHRGLAPLMLALYAVAAVIAWRRTMPPSVRSRPDRTPEFAR
jgi:hypothetical protein